MQYCLSFACRHDNEECLGSVAKIALSGHALTQMKIGWQYYCSLFIPDSTRDIVTAEHQHLPSHIVPQFT